MGHGKPEWESTDEKGKQVGGGNMQNVMHHLTRVVVALVAITTAGLACAAYNFVDLNYEATVNTQAWGTNDQGLVVGAAWADGPSFGWVYDPKEQTFTDLPPLPGCGHFACGIANSGVIAGSCNFAPNLTEGFILKKGTYTRFAYPGFDHTEPRAISTTGLVTGFAGNQPNPTSVGFIYDPASGTFTDIAIPGMYAIIPQGTNARGRVVGSVNLLPGYAYEGSPQGRYGFLREPSGAVTLFRVNGQPTAARGINDVGVIVGFIHGVDGGPYVGWVGTLASLGGFQTMTNAELITVPFAGATDTFTVAIDNIGRIVGTWVDGSGGNHGFIATPVRKGQKW
jgi:hypothetical protein